MNEFLQNLRNQTAAKERRYNKNQKTGYESGNQPSSHHPERRGGIRTSSVPAKPRTENQAFQSAIEALVEIQRARALAADRLVDAEKRKAKALERLSDNLERLLESFANTSDEAASEFSQMSFGEEKTGNIKLVDTTDDEVRKTSKRYILKFIDKLRGENMTYEQIAQYLAENNYPTFSGRGRWHAQTIHRLCKDNRQSHD